MRWIPVAMLGILIAAADAKMMKKTAKAGSAEYNESLGRSFVADVLNNRDAAGFQQAVTKLMAANFKQHNMMAAAYGPGRDGLLKFFPAVLASFPDAKFTLRDAVANKERVVVRWTFTGTLTGEPFLGVAAKGQKVEFDGFDEWAVKDGQLDEHWDAFDWVRFLTHLGAKEVPAAFGQLAAPPGGG